MLSKSYRFKSERLQFRGIEERDAEKIVEWRSDPENYRNFLNSKPITVEEHLSWFSRYLNDQTRFDFLIEDADGNAVGTCGLSNITTEECEVSYMIGNVDMRGRGYATESVLALVPVAFRELGVSQIYAQILPHNIGSIRVVEKSGFTRDGDVFRLDRSRAFERSSGHSR